MTQVFDDGGNLVADIPLSEKQLALLNKGWPVETLYHTPRALRGLHRSTSGSFRLQKVGPNMVVDAPASVLSLTNIVKAADDLRRAMDPLPEANSIKPLLP